MTVLPQKTVEIGGQSYILSALSYAEGRPAYSKLQRLMAASDILEETGVGLFMFAGMTDVFEDEDMKYFVELFGRHTQLAVSSDKTIPLNSDASRTTAFACNWDAMYEWLDACVEFNFSGVKGKLQAARKRIDEKNEQIRAAEKAKNESSTKG